MPRRLQNNSYLGHLFYLVVSGRATTIQDVATHKVLFEKLIVSSCRPSLTQLVPLL
jgi:hypothetical protein